MFLCYEAKAHPLKEGELCKQQLGNVQHELEDILSTEQCQRQQADQLQVELKSTKMQFKLDKLRTIENLQVEHQRQLERKLKLA